MAVKTYSLDLPFARDPGADYVCQFNETEEATHWSQAEAADGETPLGPVVYHCESHTQDAVSLAWLLAAPEQVSKMKDRFVTVVISKNDVEVQKDRKNYLHVSRFCNVSQASLKRIKAICQHLKQYRKRPYQVYGQN